MNEQQVAEWPPQWPRAYSDSLSGTLPVGDYRASAEDFQVEECLEFSPEGHGEHLWLWIEKRGLSTLDVAGRLARACEVRPRDIGYSGMKDRIAVTRQWFSVHLPGRETPDAMARVLEHADDAGDIHLLAQVRHPRKLKRGVHSRNRFVLRISGDVVDDADLERRWQTMCRHGLPNYVGPQRFGVEGRNLSKARAILARGWRKRDDRQGMLLSAARSYLFNQQLAARILDGNWATPLPGEVMMLDGTNSQFVAETIDASLTQRTARLDVHPSGVLWGTGNSASMSMAAEYEAVVQHDPLLARGLETADVRLGRRPLRARLIAPSLTRESQALKLEFELARGCFATSVLRELMNHSSL